MRSFTQWCVIGVFNLSWLAGGVEVIPIHHGSLILKWQDKVVYIDPWSRGDYTGQPPADLILITDIHGDHLDPEQVSRIRKDETVIVAPAAVQKSVPEAMVVSNGETIRPLGIQVEGVAMYNLKRGPEAGKALPHPGQGKRIHPHVRERAGLRLRRYRVHSRDEGVEGHRSGLRLHEPSLHHDSRRSRRMRQQLPAQGRVPLSPQGIGREGVRAYGDGRRRRGQDSRLVLNAAVGVVTAIRSRGWIGHDVSGSESRVAGRLPPLISVNGRSPEHRRRPLFSAGQRRIGTTGKVVKMRLSASISKASPVNLPSSGAVQRMDPTKPEVTVWGNNSWMN